MKKLLLVLLISLLFIPRVFAESLYTITAYDKTNMSQFSDEDKEMIGLLWFFLEYNMSCEGDICKNYDNSGKEMYTVNFNTEVFTINPDLKLSDNIIYMFAEEDKYLIEQYQIPIDDYDGVEILFVEPKCDSVCVKSVRLVEKSDGARENSKASFSELNGSFDVSFLRPNDYIKYKVVINNPTDKDYEIDDNVSTGKYMAYEYDYEGNDKIAHKNSDTVVYITIRYDKPVPEESFDENGTFIETEELQINLGKDIENPKTADASTIVLFALMLMLIGSIGLYKYTHRKEFLGTLALAIVLIPIGLYALEKIQISINAKITLSNKTYNLTYVYFDYIKVGEENNYSIVPNYYQSGRSCENYISRVNGEDYLSCAVFSEPIKYFPGEKVILNSPKITKPTNCEFNGELYECGNIQTTEPYRRFSNYNANESIGNYHCDEINKKCEITMPDQDIFIEAELIADL